MAGIKNEINDTGNGDTFWPIRGQRSEEVELYKQEIELLFNQWEISHVVVLNPRGKPFSLSPSAHWAAHKNVLVEYLKLFMCEYSKRPL